MGMRGMRFLVPLGAALFLTACGDVSLPSLGSSQPQSPMLSGATRGAKLAHAMPTADKREVERSAFVVTTSRRKKPDSIWSSNRTGTVGKVTAGPAFLVGLNSGKEIEAPVDLDITVPLEERAGNYVTTANTNVRLAPRVDGAKVKTLSNGTVIRVLGYDRASDWYLVAQGNRVIGYMYGKYMTRVEGGDVLLAGGAPSFPQICRQLTFEMTMADGRQDAWVNGACRKQREGWRIVGGRSLDVS